MINFPADGGNEQETGKWGEKDVSRGFPGEVTADLHNERECDNAEVGGGDILGGGNSNRREREVNPASF